MTNAPSHIRRWQFWLFVIAAFFVFIFLIRSVLLPFVLGIFTAYFLDPASDRLQRAGMSRSWATLSITACFFICIIMLSVLVIPVIASQFSGLIAALPEFITELDRHYSQDVNRWLGGIPIQMDSLKSAVTDFSGMMVKFVGDFVAGIFQSSMVVVNMFSLLLITPVVAFYLLRDWDNLVAELDSLLPRPHAQTIREQLAIIDETLAGFIRGQLNVCMLLGVFYAVGLSLAGLKFGILIGLMTGMLIILPYIGALFGTLVGMAVAFFQFETYGEIGAVLAVFLLGQALEGYYLTPKMVGSRVGLHPVWVIFAMLSGAALFGFVGVLLAIPVAAVIGVLVRFALTRYLDSSYYHGEKTARKK